MLHFLTNNHHIHMLSQHLSRGMSLYLSSIAIVYFLGYETFGEISIGLTIVSILLPLSKLGFDNILINEYSRTKEKKYIISTSFFACIIFNLFLSFSMILLYYFHNDVINVNYLILISILNLNCIQSIDLYFQAQTNYFQISYIKTTLYLFSLIVKIVIAKYLPTYIYFAIITDYLLIFIALYLYDSSIIKLLKIRYFKITLLKYLLKKSHLLIISGSLGYLALKINVFIVNYYYNLKDVGLFSLCTNLFEGWSSIFYILSIATFPSLVNKKNNKYKIIEKYLKYSNILLIVVFFVLLIVLTLFREYDEEIILLLIFIVCTVFLNFGYISSKVFIMHNMASIILLRNFILLILTFLFSIFLTDLFGTFGAAFSLLLSLFFSHFVFDYFLPKEMNYLYSLKIKSLGFKN